MARELRCCQHCQLTQYDCEEKDDILNKPFNLSNCNLKKRYLFFQLARSEKAVLRILGCYDSVHDVYYGYKLITPRLYDETLQLLTPCMMVNSYTQKIVLRAKIRIIKANINALSIEKDYTHILTYLLTDYGNGT